MKQKIKTIILTILIIIALSSVSSTYAFWTSNINASNTIANAQVSIGMWQTPSDAPQGIPLYNPSDVYNTGNLVWFQGKVFSIRNGGYSSTPPDQNVVYGPYNEVTREWRISNTYQDNSVVYYNNAFYRVANSGQFNGSALDSNPGWDELNSINWKSYKAYTTGDVVIYQGELYRATAGWTTGQPNQSGNWEKINSIAWDPNRIYSTSGIVVSYQGNYYRSNWYNQNSVPTAGGPWTQITVPTWGNRNFAVDDLALYQGALYLAIGGNPGQRRNSTPGTAAALGIWQRIDSQLWQPYNTYAFGDYVIYQGEPFQVVNASNANNNVIPGSIYNAWNKVNTSEWQWFNVYQNGNYVFYQNIPYVVVNATNANNNVIPGSIPNAFNRIDSLSYFPNNRYVINDIVIYENVAYRALQTSFGIIPGVSGSEAYWALYSNS